MPARTGSEANNLYLQMWRMRHLEIRLSELSRDGILRGSLHLATGQEALPAGACAALKRTDWITVTYRGHGYVLAKGCDLKAVVAEILGKRTGLCKGKGGKMHLTDLSHGLLGANGIVGGGVPCAVGAALSASIDAPDTVAMAVFGDGTVNQGCVHESFNMAALWRLPVIFLCENNEFAEMTPLNQSAANTDLAARVAAYGITVAKVDGNDPFAVYDAVARARSLAVAGKGPTFIEAATYRTCGHYQNDPGTAYRTKKEVESWEERAPIARFAAQMLQNKWATQAEITLIEQQARDEVDAAIQYAISCDEPDVADLMKDVLV